MARVETAALAEWEGGARLADYRLVLSDDARSLELELLWTTSRPLPADYTVFVHLQNAAGETIAQGDAPPREGFWPTSHWRVDEAVESRHVLPLPADALGENSRVLVGLYDPITLQRLSGKDAQGRPLPDGAFPILINAGSAAR